jgi:hypothetical protein
MPITGSDEFRHRVFLVAIFEFDDDILAHWVQMQSQQGVNHGKTDGFVLLAANTIFGFFRSSRLRDT